MLDETVEEWLRLSGKTRDEQEDSIADDGVTGDSELRFQQSLAYFQMQADISTMLSFLRQGHTEPRLVDFTSMYADAILRGSPYSHTFAEADKLWGAVSGHLALALHTAPPQRVDLRDYEEHFRAHRMMLLPWYTYHDAPAYSPNAGIDPTLA